MVEAQIYIKNIKNLLKTENNEARVVSKLWCSDVERWLKYLSCN